MAILNTTDDLSGNFANAFETDLDGLFTVAKRTTAHLRSAEPPSWLQLFANASEWTIPFKVAATVFLSQRARNAADDLWKNKAAIAAVLRDRALAPLLKLASVLVSAKQRARARTNIVVGLPLPDEYFGTTLIVPCESVEDAAVSLAVFITRVEMINELVRAAINAEEGPSAQAQILIWPDGKVVLRWQHKTTLDIIERELPQGDRPNGPPSDALYLVRRQPRGHLSGRTGESNE